MREQHRLHRLLRRMRKFTINRPSLPVSVLATCDSCHDHVLSRLFSERSRVQQDQSFKALVNYVVKGREKTRSPQECHKQIRDQLNGHHLLRCGPLFLSPPQTRPMCSR